MQLRRIAIETVNSAYSEVMSNDKRYIVPKFQRDYSWDLEQWEALWQDIQSISDDRMQHFMGYMILQEDPDDMKVFSIIDGQQRLTTLSIVILAALSRLRHLIDSGNDIERNTTRMDLFRKRYFGVKDPVTLRDFPKLELNRINNRYFQDLSSDRDVDDRRSMRDSNRRIEKALEYFKKRFDSLESGERVAEILEYISGGLVFTLVKVKDSLNAYTVFETLNARGLRLSVSDLLRNYLLSTLDADDDGSEEAFDRFDVLWEEIIQELGETGFSEFIRRHRSMTKKIVRMKDLFRHLRNDIDRKDKVFPYLEDIKEYAPIFAALHSHNDDLWGRWGADRESELRDLVKSINLLNIKMPLGVMMAGLDRMDIEQYIKLMKKVIDFSVRYIVICGKSPSPLEDLYNEMAMNITNENVDLRHSILSLKDVYPTDDEFKNGFSNKTYPQKSRRRASFFLRKIEGYLSGSEPPEDITLEHVLPYSPSVEWQEYFGVSDYSNAIDRLGNLALLPESQNLAQESFEEKKKVLKASPYEINQKIASYPKWDMDTLIKHQRWLADQANTVWRISQLS
ncbi:DUF262 domain-containing protein [Thioalkalivibrio sp. HK1]|uniref:DUF262 domain-containing protein n=1 Tax=Thioalkalivibrio sp. HK1 TaxID=1469245 RepID=UPI0009DE25E8|nr:DUF262 domain-containing protein [Thioalkalivibrio sp. HK1]